MFRQSLYSETDAGKYMDRGAKRGGEERGSDKVYGYRTKGERNEQ